MSLIQAGRLFRNILEPRIIVNVKHGYFHYLRANNLPSCKPSTITSPESLSRHFSTDIPQGGTANKEGEDRIRTILKTAFPNANSVVVEDISGGCGSMYQVFVEAAEFRGLSIVKQHQLVNKALKDEIKDMHGIRIQTQAPK